MARGLVCDKAPDGVGCQRPAYLTFSDPPSSGLGDRFSCWVMLLAVAILRGEVLLIRPSKWPLSTHAANRDGQLNQRRDVGEALDCVKWPHHSVLVHEVNGTSEALSDSMVSRSRAPRAVDVRLYEGAQVVRQVSLFNMDYSANGTLHPRGYTKSAPLLSMMPMFAYNAWINSGMLDPAVVPFERYVDAVHATALSIGTFPSCEPKHAVATATSASTGLPLNSSTSGEAGADTGTATTSSSPLSSSSGGGSSGLVLFLHLRRGDAYVSREYILRNILTPYKREMFDNVTTRVLRNLVGNLSASCADAVRRVPVLPRHRLATYCRVTFVIMSDDAKAAAKAQRDIYAAADASVESTSSSSSSTSSFTSPTFGGGGFGAGKLRMAVQLRNGSGCGVCDFFVQRYADGVFMSSMRTMSAFSVVPAVLYAYPVLTMNKAWPLPLGSHPMFMHRWPLDWHMKGVQEADFLEAARNRSWLRHSAAVGGGGGSGKRAELEHYWHMQHAAALTPLTITPISKQSAL